MSRVLIIEDEPAILRGLADILRFESYDVLTAGDGETGLELLRKGEPDLVILDLMLPKMSGYEVCRRARSSGLLTPILMLTARGEEMDRVAGLDLGADDYVSKPFSLPELLARVRALLRRSQVAAEGKSAGELLAFDDVEIDFAKYEARRAGAKVEMTRKEFEVLRYLSGHPERVITREELLERIWGLENYPTTRTVDNHILSLRTKLERDPRHPRHIVTVHGVGYKWSLEEG
ncbi:MAG: response regulator transcription factor [Acidobacteria bacterium]|nr:response regulator transcription factor [Acidobacteriota bacterium]